ncbi:MAG: glycosyltransferase family 2 protein [Candidatus Bruticola sp.]
MSRALIILTYNEIEGSKALWERLPLRDFDEVLVVDGGSSDGTVEFYQEHNIKVVGQEVRGRGEAFRVGVRNTSSSLLVFYSPDGNEDPADIVKLCLCIESGEADIAIASRFMKTSRNEEDDQLFRFRAWVNRAFTFIANTLFNKGAYVTDTINGFRAVRRCAFEMLNLDECGFPIEYQMSIRAMKKALRIVEISTVEGDRLGGESKCLSFPVGWGHVKVLGREIMNSLSEYLTKNFMK